MELDLVSGSNLLDSCHSLMVKERTRVHVLMWTSASQCVMVMGNTRTLQPSIAPRKLVARHRYPSEASQLSGH